MAWMVSWLLGGRIVYGTCPRICLFYALGIAFVVCLRPSWFLWLGFSLVSCGVRRMALGYPGRELVRILSEVHLV